MEEFDIGEFELDAVKIEPIYEELIITPALEVQTKEGSFNKVTVNAIETEELNVISSLEKQTYEGLYGKVNIEGIKTDELTIIPSKEEQIKEGIFGKVTVAGDDELIPENILKGVNIFNVEGSLDGIDTADGTATASDILEGKIAYSKNERIVGTLVNDYNAKIENFTGADALYKFITKIGEIDTSDVTSTFAMFTHFSSLKEIPKLDTSKVTVMQSMFTECTKVVTIPELDAGNVTNARTIFNNCKALTNFGGLLNIGKAFTTTIANNSAYKLSLAYSNNLTHESLMNVINKLYDLNLTYNVAGGGTLYTQTLNLGPTNIAKLTPEELAIATNKGWTVS